MKKFDYDTAFARNIGWVTPKEQAILRTKRVAIAGLGGVGGSHLLTLARLGIGAFNVADLEVFELANFNRQAGAYVNTIGKEKADVLTEMALDINPELEIKKFPNGVDKDNVESFLAGTDVYVDGLDYFAVAARRTVFAACEQRQIPAVTAAPLGMGAAVLNFLPGQMAFEEYFQLEGCNEQEQLVRFLLGLSPAMLQRSYLVYTQAVDFAAHKGPSTPMACEICAGMAATQTLKILLKRGRVLSAPWGQQFDPLRNKLARTWRPGGNKNPIQKIGLAIANRQLQRIRDDKAKSGINEQKIETPVERILDLARWAPSGDNTQPWRFEIKDDQHVTVHAFDTRDWCVYDLQGRASQIAVGALLENISIAASREGLSVKPKRRLDEPVSKPVIDVHFSAAQALEQDPLLPFIPHRVTQRRPLSTEPLSQAAISKLTASVAPNYSVIWLDGWKNKRRVARLLFKNAHIRLTIPEAYPVHKEIIEWGARFSENRIPEQAVGVDPLTARLMRWAMQSWTRVDFLNRFLGGTLLPRIQLDVLPALACASHFVLTANDPPQTIDDYFASGRALQRFWLTATSLGLQFQPEMTPLIFSSYVRERLEFTKVTKAQASAQWVAKNLQGLIGERDIASAVFMGRVGYGPAPKGRSTRYSLETLLKTP